MYAHSYFGLDRVFFMCMILFFAIANSALAGEKASRSDVVGNHKDIGTSTELSNDGTLYVDARFSNGDKGGGSLDGLVLVDLIVRGDIAYRVRIARSVGAPGLFGGTQSKIASEQFNVDPRIVRYVDEIRITHYGSGGGGDINRIDTDRVLQVLSIVGAL